MMLEPTERLQNQDKEYCEVKLVGYSNWSRGKGGIKREENFYYCATKLVPDLSFSRNLSANIINRKKQNISGALSTTWDVNNAIFKATSLNT